MDMYLPMIEAPQHVINHHRARCWRLDAGGEKENHFHFHSPIDFLVKPIEHLQLDSPDRFATLTDKRSIMASKLTRKELLSKVYKMVPPMLEKFHKGKMKEWIN